MNLLQFDLFNNINPFEFVVLRLRHSLSFIERFFFKLLVLSGRNCKIDLG